MLHRSWRQWRESIRLHTEWMVSGPLSWEHLILGCSQILACWLSARCCSWGSVVTSSTGSSYSKKRVGHLGSAGRIDHERIQPLLRKSRGRIFGCPDEANENSVLSFFQN